MVCSANFHDARDLRHGSVVQLCKRCTVVNNLHTFRPNRDRSTSFFLSGEVPCYMPTADSNAFTTSFCLEPYPEETISRTYSDEKTSNAVQMCPGRKQYRLHHMCFGGLVPPPMQIFMVPSAV